MGILVNRGAESDAYEICQRVITESGADNCTITITTETSYQTVSVTDNDGATYDVSIPHDDVIISVETKPPEGKTWGPDDYRDPNRNDPNIKNMPPAPKAGPYQKLPELIQKYNNPNNFKPHILVTDLPVNQIGSCYQNAGVFDEQIQALAKEYGISPGKIYLQFSDYLLVQPVNNNKSLIGRANQLKQLALAYISPNLTAFSQNLFTDLFIQKAKNLGAIFAHDIYDKWVEFETGAVHDAEVVRNFMAKMLPEGILESLDLLTLEKQQLLAHAFHEQIDEIFLTNQAANYLPGTKASDNLVYGILPAPWDILGSLKIPTTCASKIVGWKVGMPINNLTAAGECPLWGSVRQRHWKNKAYLHKNNEIKGAQVYEATPENIGRMEKGLAPQKFNRQTGKWESIELHHIPPQKDGGLFDFMEVTPTEHVEMDPNRYIGGGK